MATTTIQEIYNKAPAASAGDDDILLSAQNEATKGVKLKLRAFQQEKSDSLIF